MPTIYLGLPLQLVQCVRRLGHCDAAAAASTTATAAGRAPLHSHAPRAGTRKHELQVCTVTAATAATAAADADAADAADGGARDARRRKVVRECGRVCRPPHTVDIRFVFSDLADLAELPLHPPLPLCRGRRHRVFRPPRHLKRIGRRSRRARRARLVRLVRCAAQQPLQTLQRLVGRGAAHPPQLRGDRTSRPSRAEVVGAARRRREGRAWRPGRAMAMP